MFHAVSGRAPTCPFLAKGHAPKMSLTALQIRAFSPGATAYKRADERGLYLEVFPNGLKISRLKYNFAGRQKRIALGAGPEVSLRAAHRA